MDFGKVIKELRKSKGITQGEFSNHVGISQTYLSLIEKNRKKPSYELLETISEKLDFPLYYLMFKAVEVDKDISEEKRQTYNQFSPVLTTMIEKIFME